MTYLEFQQQIQNGNVRLKDSSLQIAYKLGISEEDVINFRKQYRENKLSQNKEIVVKVSLNDLDTTPSIEDLEQSGYAVKSSVVPPIAPKGFTVSSFQDNKVWYKKEEGIDLANEIDWKQIAEVFAKTITPVKLNIQEDDDITQLICISDIHVGMKVEGWGVEALNKSFQKVADKVRKGAFIEILCLGDTIDGLNSKTATKSSNHILPQDMNNQEQILNTVKAFQLLFDNLAEKTKVGEIKGFGFASVYESNHSGDMDYVIAEFLKMWLNVKYPDVDVMNASNYWGAFTIHNHNFFFSHGKDSNHMKYGLKMNLDEKTELYLSAFLKKTFKETMNFDPKHDIVISGDLHTESFNQGKFFKYYKVPAMSPSSDWVKANFGYSLPGCQYFNVGEDLFETGIISFDY